MVGQYDNSGPEEVVTHTEQVGRPEKIPERLIRQELDDEAKKKADFNPIDYMMGRAKKQINKVDEYYDEQLDVTYLYSPVSQPDWEDIQDKAKRFLSVGGGVQRDMDQNLANIHLILRATRLMWPGGPVNINDKENPGLIPENAVTTPFSDQRLIQHFSTPVIAVRTMVAPGDIIRLAEKIMRMSGFTPDIMEQGRIAQKTKNS